MFNYIHKSFTGVLHVNKYTFDGPTIYMWKLWTRFGCFLWKYLGTVSVCFSRFSCYM